jgi:hypothetical protein
MVFDPSTWIRRLQISNAVSRRKHPTFTPPARDRLGNSFLTGRCKSQADTSARADCLHPFAVADCTIRAMSARPPALSYPYLRWPSLTRGMHSVAFRWGSKHCAAISCPLTWLPCKESTFPPQDEVSGEAGATCHEYLAMPAEALRRISAAGHGFRRGDHP